MLDGKEGKVDLLSLAIGKLSRKRFFGDIL
jgi:hypothetical protein